MVEFRTRCDKIYEEGAAQLTAASGGRFYIKVGKYPDLQIDEARELWSLYQVLKAWAETVPSSKDKDIGYYY